MNASRALTSRRSSAATTPPVLPRSRASRNSRHETTFIPVMSTILWPAILTERLSGRSLVPSHAGQEVMVQNLR